MCRNPTPPNHTRNSATIIDTGATCTVWRTNASQVNHLPTHRPIHAQGPSGHPMRSSGKGRLNIPLPKNIPQDILDGHFLPALQNHSIISIGKIVDAGGICTFDRNKCSCHHPTEGTLITGNRGSNGLWYLGNNNHNLGKNQFINNTVTSVYQHSRIKDTIQFLHAALFSAPKSTILKAAKAGFLSTWPLLTPTNISKYLTETIATKKGHLARVRKNIRSTKRQKVEDDEQFNVVQEPKTHQVFMVILDTNNLKNTAYSDLTGAFPYTAANGDQYIFVFYSYDANAIMLECMKSRSDAEMLRVYRKCYSNLERRGIKPSINVMDNEASSVVKTWLTNNGIEYQLATVDNHRTNIAERCIKMAKHHIIAGLATTDAEFPIQQWNHLIPQAQHTLNMLRPSRINPKISAFTFLEGQHNMMLFHLHHWDGKYSYSKIAADDAHGNHMESKDLWLDPL